MLKVDQIVEVRGQIVRIIALDSDPRCEVYSVLLHNPDQRFNFMRGEEILLEDDGDAIGRMMGHNI